MADTLVHSKNTGCENSMNAAAPSNIVDAATCSKQIKAEKRVTCAKEEMSVDENGQEIVESQDKIACKRDGSIDDPEGVRDISSDEHKLHNFMMKGVSLGYDHKTVLSALRHVSSETTMSGFVEALIRCEEQSNASYDNLLDDTSVRVQKLFDYCLTDTQAIIDGIDLAANYHKDQNPATIRGVQIAFHSLQNYNFNRCVVVFTSWPSFTNNPNCQDFIRELAKSNSIISLADEPLSTAVKVLKQTLKNKCVVFCRGYSNRSLLHLFQANRQVQFGRQISIACYHFDGDRFIVDGIRPLITSDRNMHLTDTPTHINEIGKNVLLSMELCPYGSKCTYGNKCKYYHPERGTVQQLSLTEQLMRKAHIEREKLEESFKGGSSLSAIVVSSDNQDCKTVDKKGQSVGRFAIERCDSDRRSSSVEKSDTELCSTEHEQGTRATACKKLKHAALSMLPPTGHNHQSRISSSSSRLHRIDNKILNATAASAAILPNQQQNIRVGKTCCLDQKPLFEFSEPTRAPLYHGDDLYQQQYAQSNANSNYYFTWSGRVPWMYSQQHTVLNPSSYMATEKEECAPYYLPAIIHQANSVDALQSLSKVPPGFSKLHRSKNSRLPPPDPRLLHSPRRASLDPAETLADGVAFVDHQFAHNCCLDDYYQQQRVRFNLSSQNSVPDQLHSKLNQQYFMFCRPDEPPRTSDLGSSTFSNSSRSVSLSSSLSSGLNAVGSSFSDLSLQDTKASSSCFSKPKSDWHIWQENNAHRSQKLFSLSSTDLAANTTTEAAAAYGVKTETTCPIAQNQCQELAGRAK